MKVVSIVGARPQFIKASAVSREMRRAHQEILVHTGQHYDFELSRLFFEELEIPAPDYNLGVGSGTHGSQTAKILEGMESVLSVEGPCQVLVYGDTNSTLAGALAAAKLHLPVIHVEAGLRSFDRRMPEEVNRVVTDHVSTVLCCPCERAVRQLEKEGIARNVFLTGDVMYDVLLSALDRLSDERGAGVRDRLRVLPREYYVCTVHRSANTDDRARLTAIFQALELLELAVVLPAHPRLRRALQEHEIRVGSQVKVIEPLGYMDMLQLVRNASCVLTDSGGLQKEAYWLGVPCVTLREETEWAETVEAGWNVLAGADVERIVETVATLRPNTERPAVYGRGRASREIVAALG